MDRDAKAFTCCCREEVEECVSDLIRGVDAHGNEAARALSPEQRLWFDVICSAIREAFSADDNLRLKARDWLFSTRAGDFSAEWAFEAVGVVPLKEVRAWVRRTEIKAGSAAANRLMKARP